ncbi:ATP-binding protein [Haloarcula sp. S1CR25-12]|uniref:histidine kinase n=1 Tax=Haloarcula saliterrae TaxID=2950534 RepID=A0ABU2FCA9_9EURY|nr:histidine kinase N-terminal 7TM domain-containing protein [Haloarcula sp. S1CR25-12]MDS0259902.1 ATP-binding protein [Haloarcula sp. S1CR25-12]
MVDAAGTSVIIALLMVTAAGVSFVFVWYSWFRADHPISETFALLMLADGLWALFSFLGYISPTDAIALLWPVPTTAASSFGTVAWFIFVTRYTADSEWIPVAVERALFGLAALYVTLFALNPGGVVHAASGVGRYGLLRLPYPEPGPVLLGYTLFTYVLLAVTFGLLGRFLLRTRNLYRKQAALIFGATIVVTLSTVFYVAGFSLHPQLVLTPVFLVVQAVGIGIALYRYDFLDVSPMAAHTLLAEMEDPVFVVNTDGRIADWNRAAAAHIDTDDAYPAIDDIGHPELSAALASTDGGAESPTPTVTTTATRNGRPERVTFDVRTTAIPDRYGVVRGHAVVLRDITEQEERKRALETQNERLEEFTGVVSHDLRNPLQVIDSRIELARQTGDLSHLDDASEATQRMETLLDDLLDLAREGRVLDETNEVALADCVADAWASIAAPDAALTVETDRTLVADASRLQQVFENLFRNALDHGGTGVTITVTDTEDGFAIADDGPGIPEAERDTVFDLGMTTDADGTGFGLAIVERVVDAHGWSISVAESHAGGARFEVSLGEHAPLTVED